MEIISEQLRAFFALFGLDPDRIVFGNTLLEYMTALVLFAGLLLLLKIFQLVVLRRLQAIAERTKTDIDDAVINIFRSLKPPFYSFIAFYAALQSLSLGGFVESAASVILVVWVVYQVIIGTQILVDFLINKKLTREKDATARSALSMMGRIVKGAVWGIGAILLLSNLGVNVSSLLAGLGIGGIAIAFALQNILSDLFSSFAIYFDKPFQVGDFVVVGSHSGTVERIGIKTTRIRALQGEEIVISNKELTSTRVQNFKKMQERRVSSLIGVVYQTPTEKLGKIPEMVKEAVGSVGDVRFDRAHFKSFGDSALVFEVVYFVLTPDYTKYMDIQQEINMKIKEAFEKEKIEFAYPSQTIYLVRE